MNRHFHIVDYATPMDDPLELDYHFNSIFVISSEYAGSNYITGMNLYDHAWKHWDFTKQDESLDGVIIQKFPELDPIFDGGIFHYIIYPNIKITTPIGFHLHFDSLIPGIGVKNVIFRKSFGPPHDGTVRIDVGNKWTRFHAALNDHYLYIIDSIEFEITDPTIVSCTPEGVMFLKDQYPETNILDITFQCLHKDPHLNYEDLPKIDPEYGCDPQSPHEYAYRNICVLRNSIIFHKLSQSY